MFVQTDEQQREKRAALSFSSLDADFPTPQIREARPERAGCRGLTSAAGVSQVRAVHAEGRERERGRIIRASCAEGAGEREIMRRRQNIAWQGAILQKVFSSSFFVRSSQFVDCELTLINQSNTEHARIHTHHRRD